LKKMVISPAGEWSDDAGADLESLASEYGLQSVTSVDDSALDPELLGQLPVEWARENMLLPIRLDGKPCLLVSDPSAVSEQEYVSVLTGLELQPLLAPRELVLACIERGYFQKDNSPSDFIEDLGTVPDAADGRNKVDDLLEVANETPVTQLINLILLDAFKQRASDIHVEPFEDRLRVRYRIDGLLYEQPSPPVHLVQSLVSRLKVMSHMDIAERRLPQDGMARVRVGDREVDIRVSTVPVAEGERVVLRLLDKSSTLLQMSDLGMASGCREQFRALLGQTNGIIVVSGPTGSGKTTTLYAALGSLDSSRKNILTIEDPIEYRLDNIGQIQVKSKIGLTFSNGLRHILRQDPDVILVGETRDSETAEIAVRASLTGHLVFTTLHTNDAVSAIVRLIDMGIEPYLISACLRGILAQRLIRKLCVHCRSPHTVSATDVASYGPAWSALLGKSVWNAEGCDRCTGGYRGRVGLFELLRITPTLSDLIREGNCSLDALRQATVGDDLATLADDGIAKVLEGVTSIDEILSTTST
jgi:general secretion pathway protein E